MEGMAVPTRTRLAALLATSVVVLAACGTDDPQADDPNDSPSHSGKPSASPVSTDSPAPTQSDSATPATVAAPLYFAGDTPQGPRLFREFQQVESDNPVDEALAILTTGSAHDPDYSSLLTGASLHSGTTDEGMTIEVSGDVADRPAGMSDKEAKLAVQQVVYTVQGVLQQRIPISFVTPEGGSTSLFGLSAPDGGFKAAGGALALVNVTEPEEGSTPGDSFTASGVANSFEATVPWEIRDESGKKVLDGFSTAEGWGDKLYPWQTQVDVSSLPPGTYSFVAMTDDPSDGEGGGPKTIIIQ
jgi:hypothetical protein